MEKGTKERPYCFGKIENVFPMGKEGLRETPESCFYCIYKTECLRTAIKDPEGLKVREETVDRAYKSGMIGFFERWSRKKELQRRMKIKDSDKKE
jgi:hypothetical protein